MIEITNVQYDPRDQVTISSARYKELCEISENAFQLYRLLRQLVENRYVENYACFGNGGTITYAELAELLGFDLPEVKHIGVSEFLKAKREVK